MLAPHSEGALIYRKEMSTTPLADWGLAQPKAVKGRRRWTKIARRFIVKTCIKLAVNAEARLDKNVV